MASKKEARALFRERQRRFSSLQIAEWNGQMAAPLRQIAQGFPLNSLLAVYHARAFEASPFPLFSRPFRFCFPRALPGGELAFHIVAEPANPDFFVAGAFDILEPKAELPLVAKAAIQACFVPLLAFDGRGHRLGYGKGFYDRFLAGFSGAKIGLAFSWQESSEPFAVEAHDQPLDAIVTEKGIRRFHSASP